MIASVGNPIAGPFYRTVPEARIEAMLLQSAHVFDEEERALPLVREAIAALIDHGLGFAEGNEGRRHFDPAEVFNMLTALARSGRLDWWRDHYVETERRLHRARAAEDRTRFDVVLTRSFGAGAMLRRLRLPMPLAGPSLRVDTIAAEEPAIIHTGRIEAKVAKPGPVTLTACYSLTVLPAEPFTPDTTEDRSLWLRESEGPIQVTPQVHALAAQLAGDGQDPLTQVRAFWNGLIDEFVCGVVRYDWIGAAAATDWVIAHRLYDCRLGAALLAALCRARGIPARLAGGQRLYLLSPTNHYWAEVWIEGQGWTPFDLLAWDLSAGGEDAEWRDALFGRIDGRMQTERLPRHFAEPARSLLPETWHRLVQRLPDGLTEIAYVDASTGALAWSDTVGVACRSAGAGAS